MPRHRLLRPRTAILTLALVAAMLVTGCTPAASAPESSTPVSAPASTPGAQQNETPEVVEEPTSAEQGFRTWLELSRAPRAAEACDMMSPELVERMLAEMAAGGVPLASCEEFITTTAELYRAVGDDAEVTVDVRDETSTDATLFVTYVASGDCGTVVMNRAGSDWVITEQSQECGA